MNSDAPVMKCESVHYVYRGSSFNLTCFIDASPSPDAVTWSRVYSINERTIDSDISMNNVSAVHMIRNVQNTDSGQYRCRVSNTMRSFTGEVRKGANSFTMSITVLCKLEINSSTLRLCLIP